MIRSGISGQVSQGLLSALHKYTTHREKYRMLFLSSNYKTFDNRMCILLHIHFHFLSVTQRGRDHSLSYAVIFNSSLVSASDVITMTSGHSAQNCNHLIIMGGEN